MQFNFAPIRHWRIIFVAETKRLFAYRAQFWFELILSSLVDLTIVLTVWRAVFDSSGQTTLSGFTYSSMVLYLIVAIFFGQASRGTGMGTFQREVYEGTLTKFLIYPLSIYSYKLGTYLPRAVFALGQLALALVVLNLLGLWPADSNLTVTSALLGLAALGMACLLYFCLILCVESLSFWVDNVWALSFALQIAIVFLSGRAIPLEFFPDWSVLLLNSSPFPLMVYFPVQVFLGQLPATAIWQGLITGLIWLSILFFLSKVIIKRGLYQYTGVGQ